LESGTSASDVDKTDVYIVWWFVIDAVIGVRTPLSIALYREVHMEIIEGAIDWVSSSSQKSNLSDGNKSLRHTKGSAAGIHL
jgi:hypothetical protein